MRTYLNPVVVANILQMLRASVKGALWICDSEDAGRFFEARCAHPDAKVITAHGQSADVFAIVSNRGLKGILATVSNLEEAQEFGMIPEPHIPNLLSTPQNLSAVVSELGGVSWLKAMELVLNRRMFDAVSEFAYRIAKISALACIPITYLCDQTHAHIVQSGQLPTRDELVVICNSQAQSSENMANMVADAFSCKPPAEAEHSFNRAICSSLVFALLQSSKPHGIPAATPAITEVCWALLRTSFTMNDFERTATFWDLRDWQRKSRYIALREWRILDPFGIVWDQRYWKGDLDIIIGNPKLAQNLAVLKLDLDNFKAVNSELGHSGGDEAIRLYLTTLKDILLNYAEIYRRGGDEVVAIAPNADYEVISAIAEKLRAEIETRFVIWASQKNIKARPTASIGLLMAAAPTNSDEVALAFDAAQDEAKQTGKNKVVVKLLVA